MKSLPALVFGLCIGATACSSGVSTTAEFVDVSGGDGSGGATLDGQTSVGATTSGEQSASTTTGGSEKLGAPYPIVLAHGFFGFDDFAGAGFVTYFYEVRDHFESLGQTVYTPEVDPFNNSDVRGAQLMQKVQEILAETGHQKVNIIGHSQGGLDARVVAHERPDLVASVITLQAPHYGSPVAEIALELVDDPILQDLLDALTSAIGLPLYNEVGEQTSLFGALWQMSEEGYTYFNSTYFDQQGVYYASLAGRTDHHSGNDVCAQGTNPPFIAAWTNTTDPVDPLLIITEAILDGGLGESYANDGMVRAKDARWGEFMGCLPADHLDMMGQLFGDGPGGGNDWDHKQFYVDLVKHLRDKGF